MSLWLSPPCLDAGCLTMWLLPMAVRVGGGRFGSQDREGLQIESVFCDVEDQEASIRVTGTDVAEP